MSFQQGATPFGGEYLEIPSTPPVIADCSPSLTHSPFDWNASQVNSLMGVLLTARQLGELWTRNVSGGLASATRLGENARPPNARTTFFKNRQLAN